MYDQDLVDRIVFVVITLSHSFVCACWIVATGFQSRHWTVECVKSYNYEPNVLFCTCKYDQDLVDTIVFVVITLSHSFVFTC